MADNPFVGWRSAPSEAELRTALARAAPRWKRLVVALAGLGADVEEWTAQSAKSGWSLRLRRGPRAVVYLLPRPAGFEASFALGDEAMEGVRSGRLPASVKRAVAEAKRYPEGFGVRFAVASDAHAAAVLRLARAKLGLGRTLGTKRRGRTPPAP